MNNDLNLLMIICLFFVYCMMGWVWESCYESFLNKKLLNRGFLNGPYIPIYGFGGTFILVVLQRFQAPLLSLASVKIYIIGAIGATILEYITSYVLEKVLKARWWDYSDYPLNLNGRICLIATLFWGLVAVLAINVLNPFLVKKYMAMPHDTVLIFASVMCTLFVVDLGVTINSILDLQSRLQLMMTIEAEKMIEIVSGTTGNFSKYKNKFLNLGNPFTKRIIESFPKLRFTSSQMQKAFMKIKSLPFNRNNGDESEAK